MRDVLIWLFVVLANVASDRNTSEPSAIEFDHQRGEFFGGLDRSDFFQPGRQWRDAFSFHGFFIEKASVQIADFVAWQFGRSLNDFAGALLRQIIKHSKHPVVSAVSWDFSFFGPRTVGKCVEIFAGANLTIHASFIEAERAKRGACIGIFR